MKPRLADMQTVWFYMKVPSARIVYSVDRAFVLGLRLIKYDPAKFFGAIFIWRFIIQVIFPIIGLGAIKRDEEDDEKI